MIKKKFTASFSGGKDSILAIYKAITLGMTPSHLITTFNNERQQSWFHGIPGHLLCDVADSLKIPLTCIKTSGSEYAVNFEKELFKQKKAGAEVCVFGDIDIEEHRAWCRQRCDNIGIEAYFPLWQKDRRMLVYEFIDKGFIANITVIDKKKLNEKYLGMSLTKEIVEAIAADGADPCGENGEYHTFVSNGPIFSYPVKYNWGKKMSFDNYAVLPLI